MTRCLSNQSPSDRSLSSRQKVVTSLICGPRLQIHVPLPRSPSSNTSSPVPPCHHLSVFDPVLACMRKGRTQVSAKESLDPNCHLAGLPPELWIKILQLLPLNELWKTARPVCAFWNAVANGFARAVFYKDSKCAISAL